MMLMVCVYFVLVDIRADMPSFFVSADEGGRIRWHWDHCYCTRACDVRGARMGCLNPRQPYFGMECIYCIRLADRGRDTTIMWKVTEFGIIK